MNDPHEGRPIRPALVSVAVAALLATALVACGGDGDAANAGASGKGDDRAKLEEAALEHAECMRRQGVDVPDPKPGQGGIILRGPRAGGDPAAERRAIDRCRRYLEDVPPPRLSEEQKAAMRDGALEHARCMRKQGVDFPDPTFDEKGGATVRIGEGFDPTDPRVRRAEQRCRKHLPRPEGLR